MKLLTNELKKKLENYPIYSQENRKDATIVCKFFAPMGVFTWWVLEAEKQDNDYYFFGIIQNNQLEREYGYFTLSQLENVRLPFGLRIERDLYFERCKVSDLN